MIDISFAMKTKTIHVRIDDEETYETLKAEARRLGIPYSTYIRMLLKETSNGLREKTKR